MNIRESTCPHCAKPVYYMPESAIGPGNLVHCPSCKHELKGVIGQEVQTRIGMIGSDETR